MPRTNTASLFCLILPAIVLPGVARAQTLPRGATPRGVVVAFLRETSSEDTSVDRSAFRLRLAGELATVDPRTFGGTVPDGVSPRIDTIPDLPVTEDDEDDGIARRAVAYVTLAGRGDVENVYLFLRRDSIWKIDAIRRLPPSAARPKIRSAIAKLDTTIPANALRRADLERLLLGDDSLAALLRSNLAAVERVMSPLRSFRRWAAISLRDVDFSKIDEYRELDDDVPAGELVVYTLDRTALERVKRSLGIRRIARDRKVPSLLLMEGAAIERSHYGYLHAGEGPPPVPSPGEFIVLKPIAGGWWLYKRIASGS